MSTMPAMGLELPVLKCASVLGAKPEPFDPLHIPNLAPDMAFDARDRFERRGRNLGRLVGATAGGVAGHMLGAKFEAPIVDAVYDNTIHHAIGMLPNAHTPMAWDDNPAHDETPQQTAQNWAHNTSAVGGGVMTGTVGTILGYGVGERMGARLGRNWPTWHSKHRSAAELIRQMSPGEGLAHIRMLENSGKADPEVLKTMKDTYNLRQQGLQAQAHAGVI